MLGEFAKRIDAEVQLMMKRHRHAQQQQHKGGVIAKGPTDVHQKVNAKVSVDSSSSSRRAPASAWSERKR